MKSNWNCMISSPAAESPGHLTFVGKYTVEVSSGYHLKQVCLPQPFLYIKNASLEGEVVFFLISVSLQIGEEGTFLTYPWSFIIVLLLTFCLLDGSEILCNAIVRDWVLCLAISWLFLCSLFRLPFLFSKVSRFFHSVSFIFLSWLPLPPLPSPFPYFLFSLFFPVLP